MLSLLARGARRLAPPAAPAWVGARCVSTSAAARHGHSHGGVPCGGHHDEHGHSHTPFGPDGPDESGTLEEGGDDEPMVAPSAPPGEDTCVRSRLAAHARTPAYGRRTRTRIHAL
jgi:hypothetical protein